MTSVGIIYFFVKWIELLVLYFSGKRMEYCTSKKSYWKIAIVPIVAFALVEGLRWGRLYDYNVYAERYDLIDNFFTEEEKSSPLFTILVFTLKILGISYPVFLVIQCGFLMFSALFLLQKFKPYLRWTMPLLIITLVNNENVIRFYFSQSFVFISLYYFLENKYTKCTIYSFASILIHFAQIPFLLAFFLFGFLNAKRFTPKISVIIFLVSTFAINISDMNFLVNLATIISSYFGNSDYQMFAYLNAMDSIIHGEAGRMGFILAKITSQVKDVITYVPLLLFCPKCLENQRYGNLIYNLMVINIVLTPILGQVEVLVRFCYSFNIFTALCLGVCAKNLLREGLAKRILISCMLFCYMYAFVNAPFVREDYQMYFLWDSNGRKTNWAPYF